MIMTCSMHIADRVPAGSTALSSMLMRFAKLSPDGQYTPPPPANAKASYATLVYVRATIVEDAGWYLARSVTIAVSTASSSTLPGPALPLWVHTSLSLAAKHLLGA